jgi:fermentation-respiration switch protein FrsA (DUF1100 family)
VERIDITFRSGDDDCAAWLYRPDGDGDGDGAGTRPRPLVVMAHGFSATRDQRLDAYAERFAAAGLGALLFDYRHFGASAGEPRQLLDIRRQHADYHAAVAHARALDWVDPERVALFGSSFSGGHVIAVAAADPRIAAIVSQCPHTDILAGLRAIPPANLAKLTIAGIRDQLASVRGRPPVYVPAVGPPGTLAVMSTDDAEPGIRAITPPDSPWQNRVAARIAVAPPYRPGRAAGKLTCPALFCVTDRDSLAPAERTVALVSNAPRGEIKRYPVGHFDIYVGEAFEQAVADQTEFLVRHLKP